MCVPVKLIMHEMVSGQPLFSGTNVAAILYKHVWENPPALSEVTTKPIPEKLEQLVLEMLDGFVGVEFEIHQDVIDGHGNLSVRKLLR